MSSEATGAKYRTYFSGPLVIQAMPQADDVYKVHESYYWLDVDGRRWHVPAGMFTDLGSIPSLLWGPVLGNPASTDAAQGYVTHDRLYRYPDGLSRGECDAMLERMMLHLGASWLKRKTVRIGLQVGGWKAWNNYRTREG